MQIVEAEKAKRSEATRTRFLTGVCTGLVCGLINGVRQNTGYAVTHNSWLDSTFFPAAAFIGAYLLSSAESRGSRLLLSLITSLSCLGGTAASEILFKKEDQSNSLLKAMIEGTLSPNSSIKTNQPSSNSNMFLNKPNLNTPNKSDKNTFFGTIKQFLHV